MKHITRTLVCLTLALCLLLLTACDSGKWRNDLTAASLCNTVVEALPSADGWRTVTDKYISASSWGDDYATLEMIANDLAKQVSALPDAVDVTTSLSRQVDQVKVVTPKEVDDLKIAEGKDYCTLFTCTPYGINTHRLLVRGIRIETITEKPVIYVANEAFRIEPLLVTPAVAAPMVLVFLIHLMVKYREPPKKKEGASNHGT